MISNYHQQPRPITLVPGLPVHVFMEGTATAATTMSVTSDPVSSLRAVALSTLKSKRRKPQRARTPLPIPARPPPPVDNFQLDYGAEDTSQDVLATLPSTPTPPIAEKSRQINSGQPTAREEGEISEEEELLPSPKSSSRQRSTSRTVSSSPKRSTPDFGHSLGTAQSCPSPLLQTSKELISDTKSLVPTVKVQDSSSVTSSPFSSTIDNQMQDVVISTEARSVLAIGPECVRPGLHLNQSQYDTIKDIVLDLLGWGVPPKFLVDCGISREAIYYVFSELNLALPEGFDVSGLVPYVPDLFSGSPPPTLMPPPPLPENRRGPHMKSQLDSPVSISLSKSKISLGDSLQVESSPTVDLHDIERQRRQELLARKAVQASRKLRQSTSTDSSSGILTSPGGKNDLAMTPATPVAVDDFLNSIGSVPNLGNDVRSPSGSFEPHPPSNDVDMQGNNLNGIAGFTSPHQEAPDPPPFSADTTATNETHSSTSGGAPPTSGSSSAFSPMSESDSGTVLHSGIGSPSSVPPRRNAKRPVATDFDFDSVPRKSGSLHQPLAKQPRTTFGGIPPRRCVIDLSDSDGEDAPIQLQRLSVVGETSGPTRERRRKFGSYVSPASTKPSTPAASVSPSILLQKELEIQKMRELIAQREETRQRKLAKAAVNNEDVTMHIAQPQPRFKVEEIDIIMEQVEPEVVYADLMARRSSESASPPGEIAEASLPVTRGVSKSPIMKNDTEYSMDSVAVPQEQEVIVKTEPLPLPHQLSVFSTVDVDMLPSSSAQMNKSPTTPSALPKQDARKPSPSETLHHYPDNDNDNAEPEDPVYFINYQSLFDSYPLLRSRILTSPALFSLPMHTSSQSLMSSNFASSTWTASTTSLPSFIPDLKPLRLATLSKRLDPSKRLCQYEIPGGGTCRDNQCEDMHLSQLEGINATGVVDPSDIEAAHFLFSVLPDDWLATFQVRSPSRIHEALEQVGQQTASHSLSLEDKVTKAMALMVSSSAAT